MSRIVLGVGMMWIGSKHFTNPEPFIEIVPSYLPAHRALVLISGAAEMLGGLGLCIPKLVRPAAWGLIALYIAVFPANVNMAIHNVPINGHHYSSLQLWLRLPLQLLLIAWAWWFTRED